VTSSNFKRLAVMSAMAGLALSHESRAQSPPSFDVASIRRNRDDASNTVVRKKSIQSLSNLSFQPIIVMQSAKHWLRSDSVTSGKLMPKAAGRDTRRKGLRCSRT
jgi:hypothetical protein